MSDNFEMDLHSDPRGKVLLKIHDMTTEITDPIADSDPRYKALFEGYTAFDSGHNSIRVYLVMSKGTRLLLYCVEVPTVPLRLMVSRKESTVYSRPTHFICMRVNLNHPDDVGYLLAGEDDRELLANNKIAPKVGETSRDFILNNALWLADPVIN